MMDFRRSCHFRGAVRPESTGEAQRFPQQLPAGFTPIAPPPWAWFVTAAGTVLIAASTALITATVDRTRHPCRLASPPRPAEDDLVADLDGAAVEVLESLSETVQRLDGRARQESERRLA